MDMAQQHKPAEAILFDLDNTLFDHDYSLRTAIAAIRNRYTSLQSNRIDDLVDRYNSALQQAYDAYLAKEITYQQADSRKVQLFFVGLGLAEPGQSEIEAFRAVYKPAYQASRRVTPGSMETLVRLRECTNYRLAIVTNGQIADQKAKAKDIGVYSLVDCIITSEEAGHPKPDSRIFEIAMRKLNVCPETTLMVGDSAESDIKGALSAGLSRAILYSPLANEPDRLLFGKRIPMIRHMEQLLDYLGIASSC